MSEMCSVCIVRAQRDDDDFLPCSPACFRAAVRACEKQVQEEDQRSLIKYGVQMFMHGKQYGRPMGYAAGLDAAQEAVLALFPQWRYPDEHAALVAAIDALKEKP